jgi:DNA-binding MarR family transcriptional regulator
MARAREELALRLHSAVLHLMRRIRREDDVTGLSAPRLAALSCVVFAGPRTLGELATMEQVSPPTMTNVVAGLERDGYVRRETPPEDRRVVLVRATPKGRRVMERSRRLRAAFLAEKLEGLDPDELAALDRAADIMLRIYEQSRTTLP